MFGFSRQKHEAADSFDREALPHLEDVYRVALWLSRDTSEAEDLTQETFVTAYKSFHRYEAGTNCKAWLMTILHYTDLNRRKQNSKLRIVDDPDELIASTVAFEPPIPQTLTDESIIDALRRLPEQFRHVVIMADVEEFAYKEVSAILNVPIGTVMSRLHRGRKLLRAELASHAAAIGLRAAKAAAKG